MLYPILSYLHPITLCHIIFSYLPLIRMTGFLLRKRVFLQRLLGKQRYVVFTQRLLWKPLPGKKQVFTQKLLRKQQLAKKYIQDKREGRRLLIKQGREDLN